MKAPQCPAFSCDHTWEAGPFLISSKGKCSRIVLRSRGWISIFFPPEFSHSQVHSNPKVTASGIWISDRTHGLQFKAEVLKTTPPTGVEGIEKYLASGQMRGIGPAMAKRIVAAFGVDTFEIIEASPSVSPRFLGSGPCEPPGSSQVGPSRKRCGRS